jgi:hypothetical protein
MPTPEWYCEKYWFRGKSKFLSSSVTTTPDTYLSGPILKLLGWPLDAKIGSPDGGAFTSPNIADITGGMNSLLVYVSIIENTNVGSFQVPLLATIPLGNASPGDIIQWIATGPDYEAHNLNIHSFQSIEVDIRDTRGESIDFNKYDLSIHIGIRKTS